MYTFMKEMNFAKSGYEMSHKGLETVMEEVRRFSSPKEAVAHIQKIYDESVAIIREQFALFVQGKPVDERQLKGATYPYLAFSVNKEDTHDFDTPFSYGVLGEKGLYGTSLTDPHLFNKYYLEQISAIMENNKIPALVGKSYCPIPFSYVISHVPDGVEHVCYDEIRKYFTLPDLYYMNDHIANSIQDPRTLVISPLSLFTAERVDYSLKRLHHYTHTSPHYFQNFVILTNYQRYMSRFRKLAQNLMDQDKGYYTAFVASGDKKYTAKTFPAFAEDHEHLPQMPAYHLLGKDGNGITFINIGIGPSNAKNITDHLAVLRPHCWLMMGHCAGFRRKQALGDYVLAQAYVRDDQVLNKDLPTWVPIPPIAEVQVAMQEAFMEVTGLEGEEMKRHLRTGTVATTDDRNWELRADVLFPQFRQSRAIALDMESATVAANGFRFRVPYGSLLCVSDKPIHGELKMKGMAQKFYEKSVQQHLEIGLLTVEILRARGIEKLHSRKLRGFDEVPFR